MYHARPRFAVGCKGCFIGMPVVREVDPSMSWRHVSLYPCKWRLTDTPGGSLLANRGAVGWLVPTARALFAACTRLIADPGRPRHETQSDQIHPAFFESGRTPARRDGTGGRCIVRRAVSSAAAPPGGGCRSAVDGPTGYRERPRAPLGARTPPAAPRAHSPGVGCRQRHADPGGSPWGGSIPGSAVSLISMYTSHSPVNAHPALCEC